MINKTFIYIITTVRGKEMKNNHSIRVDVQNNILYINNAVIHIQPIRAKILNTFIINNDKYITKKYIIDCVYTRPVKDISPHIFYIKETLECYNYTIIHEINAGYKIIYDSLLGKQIKQIKINTPIYINLQENNLHIGKHVIRVQPKQAEILFLLIKSINRTISKEYIVDNAWPFNDSIEYGNSTISVHISNLRKILKLHNYAIINRSKTGYKLINCKPTKYDHGLLSSM